jgi:transcriptional regulator with XRE-family HTH domain
MIENPLKTLRQRVGMTQAELAAQAGVTRQVVLLSEQGLLHRPSAKVLQALTAACLRAGIDVGGVNSSGLITANYLVWVDQKRVSNSHLFSHVDLRLCKSHDKFAYVKSHFDSNMAFCRALVYQPSLVREFEKKKTGIAGIYAALRAVGVDPSGLEA